jgi:tetratricopeptide (TPR) repeat protein
MPSSTSNDPSATPMNIFIDKYILCFLIMAGGVGAAQAASSPALCGELANGYGPFDYRKYQGAGDIVTGAHFTPIVKSLRSGKTAATAGPDIAYTLRAIPNYPEALVAVIRLGEKEKTEQPIGMPHTVECWLERAVRFQPDDVVARMIFATYLNNKQRKAEARAQLNIVKEMAEDNPFTHFNLGMIYADLGDYDDALEQAHLALELGHPSVGLRERLTAVGKWREPVDLSGEADAAESVEAAASAASAASSNAK